MRSAKEWRTFAGLLAVATRVAAGVADAVSNAEKRDAGGGCNDCAEPSQPTFTRAQLRVVSAMWSSEYERGRRDGIAACEARRAGVGPDAADEVAEAHDAGWNSGYESGVSAMEARADEAKRSEREDIKRKLDALPFLDLRAGVPVEMRPQADGQLIDRLDVYAVVAGEQLPSLAQYRERVVVEPQAVHGDPSGEGADDDASGTN